MTVTADDLKVVPASKPIQTGPVRKAAAESLLALARNMSMTHPEMSVHRHLEDAADQVRIGNDDGAVRHLRAVAWALQPPVLHRHGIHDDAGHVIAQQALQDVIRHHHLVRDLQDAEARNQAAIMRDSYGDDTTAPRDPNAGYGPGALAQKPVARQPPGDQALNAPARQNTGRTDANVADPVGAQRRGSKQFARSRDELAPVSAVSLTYGWDDLAAAVVELSARTPMLESTPAPRGRPGGPGLYFLKGNKHSDYFENVVRALIEKRGMPPGRAYAIAWGALRRWASGKGKVHPEVRAAAGGALAGEAKASAAARAAHGHAVSWDELASVVELAAVAGAGWDGMTWAQAAALVDLAVVNVKTYQRTVNTPNGPVTQTIAQHPQNYKSGTGQPAPAGKQQGGKPFQQLPSKQAEKQRLLSTAAGYRQQAAILTVEENAFNSALQNALYGSNTTQSQTGATTGAQKGATTGAQTGATTAAATAAQQAGTTATTAAQQPAGTTSTAAATGTGTTAAQTGATTAAQTGATTTAQGGATTTAQPATVSAAQAAVTAALQAGVPQAQITHAQQAAQAAAAGMSVPQLRTTISQLQTQITWYDNQAASLTAQAQKL